MQLLTDLFIIICLAIIVVQDMKQREISWVLIPLTMAAFIYKAMMYKTIFFNDVLFNIGFIVLQLTLLTLYMSIKNRKPINIINTHLGLGDVLFFLVLAMAFSPVNFIAFYLLSLIVTLIIVVLYNSFSNKRTTAIPLAGAMAATLIILMVTNNIIPSINFYNDGYLLESIKNII